MTYGIIICVTVFHTVCLQLRNEIPILLQVCCVDLYSRVDACSCNPWIWYAVGYLKLIYMRIFSLFSFLLWCVITHFWTLFSLSYMQCWSFTDQDIQFTRKLSDLFAKYYVLNCMFCGNFETFVLELCRFATLCWIIVAALFILIGILSIVSRYCFYLAHCLLYSVSYYI
jgi:hypothetical protein